MGNIFYVLTMALQIFLVAFGGYYGFITLFSFYKKKENKDYTPNNTFAMVVAAHNEEVVIGKLIESLKNQEYPKEMYDIFVIADNCTDKTAEIARACGANVYERFNKDKRGKG